MIDASGGAMTVYLAVFLIVNISIHFALLFTLRWPKN